MKDERYVSVRVCVCVCVSERVCVCVCVCGEIYLKSTLLVNLQYLIQLYSLQSACWTLDLSHSYYADIIIPLISQLLYFQMLVRVESNKCPNSTNIGSFVNYMLNCLLN